MTAYMLCLACPVLRKNVNWLTAHTNELVSSENPDFKLEEAADLIPTGQRLLEGRVAFPLGRASIWGTTQTTSLHFARLIPSGS